MEFETCKNILKANDLTNVINIVLIHLSSQNSDEERFVREVREATGKQVYAAKKNLTINLNKVPY
jgi:ribonuclease BN (tRNA processing enzyme)